MFGAPGSRAPAGQPRARRLAACPPASRAPAGQPRAPDLRLAVR